MRKIIVLIVLCAAIAMQSMAQNMKVVKFEHRPNDMTASTYGTQKTDLNGQTCAIIKVVPNDPKLSFEAGSLSILAVEDHGEEMWIYLPRFSKKLTIKHREYGMLRDYEYPIPIEGGRTYEMWIDYGVGRYVNIESQVAGSTIYIDGEQVGTSPINHYYLTYREHTIRAVKDRHEGDTIITVRPTDEEGLRVLTIGQRDMSDHFGDVTVTVDNNADIYFEGQIVGTGQWQRQLREGMYTIETRKADCDPVQTSFTVVAQQQNDVTANPPTPHTGWLRIYTRPNNVVSSPERYSNLSEALTLNVGSHQIDFSRKGYVSQTHEYIVRHNETTRDTVTLERIKYVKPIAFYFGVGYAVRGMSGLTGLLGAVIQRHDVEAHYTFGLSSSDPVHAYSVDGNDNYLSTLSYQQTSFGIKYGYQFNLMRQLAITPQLGFSAERLSGTVENGSGLYADGASCNNLTIGVKLLLVPFQHCYLFASPEYGVAVSKDNNYQRLTELSNVTAGGFMATIGLIVNF